MSFPEISVIMAVYNGAGCIRQTIESVLCQTYKDFEFIIVNDASSDATQAVIEEFSDPRIILISNERNRGQTSSLNIGLQKARGAYIARIDAGDISLPTRLEKQIAFLEAHADVVVLGAGGFRYNEERKFLNLIVMPLSRLDIREKILFTSPLIHISVMMRREYILAAGGYDEKYKISADYDLWSRIVRSGGEIANIPDILVGYEVSSKSFSRQNDFGASTFETIEIIKKNVLHFCGIQLEQKIAEYLYRFLSLDMAGLSLDQARTSEDLYRKILAKADVSSHDQAFFVSRLYARYFFITRHTTEKEILLLRRYAARAALRNFFGSIISNRLYREAFCIFFGLVWRKRNKRLLGSLGISSR